MMNITASRLVMGITLTLSICGAAPTPTDDLTIPAKCRPYDAKYNERCRDVIDARSAERNRLGNQRDAKANTVLKEAILSTSTKTGETIAQVLDQVPSRIPFYISGWHFVYARSGARYVVLSYEKERVMGKTAAEETRVNAQSSLDYDLETEDGLSLQNSIGTGYVVWKIEGNNFVPWGKQSNMLVLGSSVFTYAVNQSREGLQNSGFDAVVAKDLSFLDAITTEDGKLSAALNGRDRSKLEFYWNIVDGYTVTAPSLDCPPRKIGKFTIQGENCLAKAMAAKDISGKVLPFKIIRAIRNHHFINGIVQAAVSISVDGGSSEDWMATATYVAEHSIIGDVTCSQVYVFVENPWGDAPPQRVKILARVYYGPDLSHSPWPEKWTILSAQHAATPADVEFDELSNDLIEDPDKVPDAEQRLIRAETAARRKVIQKFHLPRDWKPTPNLGMDGKNHDREHVHITGPDKGDNSLVALTVCLRSTCHRS